MLSLNLRGYLLLCCLLITYGIYAQDRLPAKEKTITNQLYSFTVPAHWQVSAGASKAGNENIPFERDDKYFHLYYLGWNSAIEEFHHRTSLAILSYRTLDGSPLSIDKVERTTIPGIVGHPLIRNTNKSYLPGKNGQKRILIKQEEADLSGEYHKLYYYYLLQKDKEIVHCLSISIREEDYNKQPDAQKTIDRILNSFTINRK